MNDLTEEMYFDIVVDTIHDQYECHRTPDYDTVLQDYYNGLTPEESAEAFATEWDDCGDPDYYDI